MTEIVQKFADATPSKSFFIDMLTRDISVADAILDLVDNAVDKAVELEELDVTALLYGHQATSIAGRRIDISLSPDEFRIEDTCGGIALEEAEETVFRFGNPEERGADFGLSVYGIGMKRAFFKHPRKPTANCRHDDRR
ncbi:MAG: ATP-binding protein [Acidobacteriota bacterium]